MKSAASIDTALVRRAKGGDSAAFAEIYERYAPKIYRYIYYRIGEVEAAEDACADVFLAMVEDFGRYEDRGWPLSAWLYRMARDRAIDLLRKRRTRQHIPLETWSGSWDGVARGVEQRLQYEEVARTLCELTAEQRAVIQLRFVEQQSVAEVAEQLGRTEGAIKALQHRGVQALARHLSAAASVLN